MSASSSAGEGRPPDLAHRPRHIKMPLPDRVFIAFNTLFLIGVFFIIVYPIWYAVIASISDPASVLSGAIGFTPVGFTLEGYRKVFNYSKILTAYKNTFVYTICGTFVNTAMVTITAYPLSKKELWGNRFFTLFFAFTMYFSGGLIPTYLVIRGVGLYDSMWALIVPFAINMWNVVIMRSFFQTGVPNDILESASIDGCGQIKALIRIVLPLSMPVLSVILLYHAVYYWNSYFNALIYLSTESKYPLQMILRELLIISDAASSVGGGDSVLNQVMFAQNIKYSLIIVASLPILCLYPFLQKYFEKGIMVGAVKG